MARTSRWHRAMGAGVVVLGLLLLAAAFATSASAHPTKKQFRATITALPPVPEDDTPADSAAEAWAGASPTVKITLTNLADKPRLGSANLTVPAGVAIDPATLSLTSTQSPFAGTVSASGGVIRLRDLALHPGKSVTLSVGARAECSPAHAPYAFTTAVKESNAFNGTGNDFIIDGPQPALDLVGRCSLAFGSQPANAQRSSDITSEVYLPTGAPVTVAVLDGSGVGPVTWWTTPITLALDANPGGATLSGFTAAAPVQGVAKFLDPGRTPSGPRLNISAAGYRFTAASAGITAAPPQSSSFGVVDVGRRCVGQQSCAGSTSNPKSTAAVSALAGNNNDLLSVSLGSATSTNFTCAGYTTTTDVLDFNLTSLSGAPSGGPKTAAFTLLAKFVTRPAKAYEACFLSNQPFTTKSGAPATGVDTNGDGVVDSYAGLLPNCDCRHPVPPCVVSKERDKRGNVTITIVAPPGDPGFKF